MPWFHMKKNFKRSTSTYNENYAVRNSTITTHNKLHAEVHTLSKIWKSFARPAVQKLSEWPSVAFGTVFITSTYKAVFIRGF